MILNLDFSFSLPLTPSLVNLHPLMIFPFFLICFLSNIKELLLQTPDKGWLKGKRHLESRL